MLRLEERRVGGMDSRGEQGLHRFVEDLGEQGVPEPNRVPGRAEHALVDGLLEGVVDVVRGESVGGGDPEQEVTRPRPAPDRQDLPEGSGRR